MSFWRRSRQPVRTKLCSTCREVLAWEATGCQNCGAGDPTDPPDEGPSSGIARFLSSPARMLLVLAALALVGGGYFTIQGRGQRQGEINRLRQQQSALDAQVDGLSARHRETERRATQAASRAQELMRQVGHYEEQESTRKNAERLLAEVKRLSAELDDALDELGKIKGRLFALGESP